MDSNPQGELAKQEAELGHLEITLVSLIRAGGVSHQTWFQLEQGQLCLSVEWNGEKGLSLSRKPPEPTRPLVETPAAEARRFIDKRLDRIEDSVSPHKAYQPPAVVVPSGEGEVNGLLSELENVKKKQIEESVRAMTAETVLQEERAVWNVRLERQVVEEDRLSNELSTMRSQLFETSNQVKLLQQQLGRSDTAASPDLEGRVDVSWKPSTPSYEWAPHASSTEAWRASLDKATSEARQASRAPPPTEPRSTVSEVPRSRRSSIPDVPDTELPGSMEAPGGEIEEALAKALSLAEGFKQRAEAAERQIGGGRRHAAEYSPRSQPPPPPMRPRTPESTPQRVAGGGGGSSSGFQNKLLSFISSTPEQRSRSKASRSYPVPQEVATIGLPSFASMDTDGNGVISREEYARSMIGAQRLSQQRTPLRNSSMSSRGPPGTPTLEELQEEEEKLRKQMLDLVSSEFGQTEARGQGLDIAAFGNHVRRSNANARW